MSKAINRSGIYLYSKDNALQFINECKKQKVAILGIDGFYLDGNTTQPSMENSIDFSTKPFIESIYDEAINFLEFRDDKMYFEIVCSE
jgi:hypothetical protein